MSETKLELWGDNDGSWYVLYGGGNWASVEGFPEEWRAIRAALRAGKDVSFKRCAARHLPDGGVALWSPRNTVSERGEVKVPADEVHALANAIDKGLAQVMRDAFLLHCTDQEWYVREHGDGAAYSWLLTKYRRLTDLRQTFVRRGMPPCGWSGIQVASIRKAGLAEPERDHHGDWDERPTLLCRAMREALSRKSTAWRATR